MELLQDAIKGSVRSLGKIISIVENESSGFREVLKALYPYTGKAKVIGVTGPPGVGKSTLVGRLAKVYQSNNHRVGILAVDPSSPISGGSLLGDRIRMSFLFPADNIFIRSLSSRGTLGGISQCTMNVVRVLDASGYDIIIIETVGVGQDEFEVIHVADTAVLVLASGYGDEIQALKAGIMEVADIFVINKADQLDTSKYVHTLEKMILQLSPKKPWIPPIVKTIALSNQGCEELIKKIEEHFAFCQTNETLIDQKKKKHVREIERLVGQKIREEIEGFFREEYKLESILDKKLPKDSDPYTIAEDIVSLFWKSRRESNSPSI